MSAFVQKPPAFRRFSSAHGARLRPSLDQLESELAYERQKGRTRRVLRNTVYALLAAAAVAVLVATLWLPVLRITGASMAPTLSEGDFALAVKGTSLQTGDVVAFYHGSRILVKRVIASPGEWVDVKDDGTVYVDNRELDEPYLTEKSLGKCDMEMPCQVPDGSYFVMGDSRSVSVDSRNTSVGYVAQEDVVGEVVFRFWPLSGFGAL